MMVFADFVVNCDCLHKNDHRFSELFIHFSLMTICDAIKQNQSEVGQNQFYFNFFWIDDTHHLQDYILLKTPLKLNC